MGRAVPRQVSEEPFEKALGCPMVVPTDFIHSFLIRLSINTIIGHANIIRDGGSQSHRFSVSEDEQQ